MNTKTTLTLAAALLATPAIKSQQNPQPQPQNAAGTKQADPCAPASATETRAKNRIWGKVAAQIDAHAWQIGKGSHGMVDNNDVKGAAADAASSAAKPCVQKPVVNTNPHAITPPSTPESKPIISADGKRVYVCSAGTQRVPEFPICKRSDGTYVPMTEIPLPAGVLNSESNGPDAASTKPVSTTQPSQSATPASSQAAQTSGAQHN
jgi:hypothetical protein